MEHHNSIDDDNLSFFNSEPNTQLLSTLETDTYLTPERTTISSEWWSSSATGTWEAASKTSAEHSGHTDTTEVVVNVAMKTAAENDGDPSKLPAVRAAVVAAYALLFVGGTVGNLLVLLVLARFRTMRSVTNLFIGNLALTDLMLCLLAVPLTPLPHYTGQWAFGEYACHVLPMVLAVGAYVATLTSTAIAVNRYLMIVHPFTVQRMSSVVCGAVTLSIWLVSILVSLPLGVYQDVTTRKPQASDAHTLFVSEPDATAPATRPVLLAAPDNDALLEGAGITLASNLTEALGLLDGSSLHQPPPQHLLGVGTNDGLGAGLDYGDEEQQHQLYQRRDPGEITACSEAWPQEDSRQLFTVSSFALQFVIPCGVIIYCYERIARALRERVRNKCEARRISHLTRPLPKSAHSSTAASVENDNEVSDARPPTAATSVAAGGGSNEKIERREDDSSPVGLPPSHRSLEDCGRRPKLSWGGSLVVGRSSSSSDERARCLKSNRSLASQHSSSSPNAERSAHFPFHFSSRYFGGNSVFELAPLMATGRSVGYGGFVGRCASSSSTNTESTTRSHARANTMERLLHEKDLADIRHKRRTNRMLIAMVCAFCACWMPLNVLHLTLDFGSEFELRLDRWPPLPLVFFCAHLLAMSATLVHPVLYGAMNQGFRRHLALLCARNRALRALKEAMLSHRCLMRSSPSSTNFGSNAVGPELSTSHRLSGQAGDVESLRPPLRDLRGSRTPPVNEVLQAMAISSASPRQRRITPAAAPLTFCTRVRRLSPITASVHYGAMNPGFRRHLATGASCSLAVVAKHSPLEAAASDAAANGAAAGTTANGTAVALQVEAFASTAAQQQKQQLTPRRSHSMSTTSAEIHPQAHQQQLELHSMPPSAGGTRTQSIPDIVVNSDDFRELVP